jgi:hypothetical protein
MPLHPLLDHVLQEVNARLAGALSQTTMTLTECGWGGHLAAHLSVIPSTALRHCMITLYVQPHRVTFVYARVSTDGTAIRWIVDSHIDVAIDSWRLDVLDDCHHTISLAGFGNIDRAAMDVFVTYMHDPRKIPKPMELHRYVGGCLCCVVADDPLAPLSWHWHADGTGHWETLCL